MRRFCFILNLLLVSGTLGVTLRAQDAEVGVTVPVTITGDLIRTNRTLSDDPTAGSLTAGFRALIKPQAKLGPNLYFYSAVQVYSAPFFYKDRYITEREIETSVLQAFVGYTRSSAKGSASLKAGKMRSAFGAFPTRYDDTANALLDQPLPYTYLRLRPDQLPCGVGDLRRVSSEGGVATPQTGPDVDYHCGGSEEESYGISPVTLYGLMGVETDVSWHRLDARLQLTNSSPANPRGALQSGQHPQGTAGIGYTVSQGFRIGMSAFRGPWLDNAVKPYLPAGSSVSDFRATGLGIDVQWARGWWSVNGEWERFAFQYPGFSRNPVSTFAYAEVKRILSPRWYSALRANYQANNRPEASGMRSPAPYLPNLQAYEIAIGFRPNRFQLLKAGYEWTSIAGDSRTHDGVFGIQFVTSIDALSKVLR